MFSTHRRLALIITLCSVSAIIASCGGSQLVSTPSGAQRPVGFGSAVRDHEVPTTFNGTWGLEYAEGIYAANNGGLNSTGACSGAPKHLYNCGEFMESVTKAPMPSLNISAPPTDAPSIATAGGFVDLGNIKVNLAGTAGFVAPDYVADASGYQSTLYWTDQIIPPTPDANHSPGTPITYTASIAVHYTASLDCEPANSYFQTTVGGNGLTKDLYYTAGCSTSGTNHTSTTMTTSYGGAPLTIDDTLYAFIYAATSAIHTASSSSFSNIHVLFHLNEKSGATYSTASGVCYKTTGTCP